MAESEARYAKANATIPPIFWEERKAKDKALEELALANEKIETLTKSLLLHARDKVALDSYVREKVAKIIPTRLIGPFDGVQNDKHYAMADGWNECVTEIINKCARLDGEKETK